MVDLSVALWAVGKADTMADRWENWTAERMVALKAVTSVSKKAAS
jgi:hypothetical protein